MKIGITGASHFVNRMFEACGRFQWAREFLQNSVESGATRVHFGIEWQAVEKAGVYRRTIIDDGEGMDPEELLRFFSTLGAGGKKIGGIHDNFGVGAKVAAMPWNSYGIVVVSYKNGQSAMIWIRLNESTGDYELIDYDTENGVVNVIEPEDCSDQKGEWCDWSSLRPDWVRDHGTIIVLLGNDSKQDTIMGKPQAEENAIKGLSRYLNTRFWDLENVQVTVAEPRSENKTLWPKGPGDRNDATRVNNREIKGAKHWLITPSKDGRPCDQGIEELQEGRLLVEWYLWEGPRPGIHSYAQKGGYIAVRYKGELFEVTNSLHDFRAFGILEQAVRKNLTLILDPVMFNKNNGVRWGIYPDQSRNRLIFTGNGRKGDILPMADWGAEFAANLPQAILAAIREARGDGSGSIQDEEYRKRLMDRFGSRWSVLRIVESKQKEQGEEHAEISNDKVIVLRPAGKIRQGNDNSQSTRKSARRAALPRFDGQERGIETNALNDIPRYRFAHEDDFENRFHLAAWAPNDPEGPTVLINIDSPILQSVVKYHQDQYPVHFAEDIADEIRRTYGEIAVAKVAHIQKLAPHVNLHELDGTYRSEQALTAGLMGLIAEESLLAQRLAKFGIRHKGIKAMVAAA